MLPRLPITAQTTSTLSTPVPLTHACSGNITAISDSARALGIATTSTPRRALGMVCEKDIPYDYSIRQQKPLPSHVTLSTSVRHPYHSSSRCSRSRNVVCFSTVSHSRASAIEQLFTQYRCPYRPSRGDTRPLKQDTFSVMISVVRYCDDFLVMLV